MVEGYTGVYDKRPQPTSSMVKLPPGVGEFQKSHLKYIRERGFDPQYLYDTWGVRGIGLNPKLSWRLFIPIHVQKRVVSWTTRSIAANSDRRYISASPEEEAVPHKTILYGADLVPGGTIIVVEGPADAWRIGPGAVATFGLSMSLQQVREIGSYPRRVLCFDNEPGARRRAVELAERTFSHLPGETLVVSLETGKDPGCAEPQEVQELRTKVGLPPNVLLV